jgi:hypothetical protein
MEEEDQQQEGREVIYGYVPSLDGTIGFAFIKS